MTREHDIKELAVYIRRGLVKLKNHRPEFCDFAWANRDAMIRALSSLAAENGRLEQRAKKAEVLLLLGWDLESAINEHPHDNIGRHATEIAQRYADNPNVKASPTLLRAALSSPAPEVTTGGDEVVP